jgi:hypothetical protein
VLAFLGYQIPSTSISFGSPDVKTFTLFAASEERQFDSSHARWALEACEPVDDGEDHSCGRWEAASEGRLSRRNVGCPVALSVSEDRRLRMLREEVGLQTRLGECGLKATGSDVFKYKVNIIVHRFPTRRSQRGGGYTHQHGGGYTHPRHRHAAPHPVRAAPRGAPSGAPSLAFRAYTVQSQAPKASTPLAAGRKVISLQASALPRYFIQNRISF